MSEANVDFLRRGYDALERGDLDTFKALARDRLDDDFEFHQVWDGRVLKGYEGTIEWLEDTGETWADYRQTVEEIADLGEQVLVAVRIEARGGGSGVPVAQELAVLWTFEGERAVEARSFTSREEALEAAGPRGSLDLFNRAMAALNRHDLDSFVALMDDRVEALPRIAAMEGVYRGPEGIRRWWNGLFGAFPDLTFESDEVRDLGDLTVAPMRLRGRGAGSDTPIDETVWHLAWWRHGKCTRWATYSTEEQALGAASASDS